MKKINLLLLCFVCIATANAQKIKTAPVLTVTNVNKDSTLTISFFSEGKTETDKYKYTVSDASGSAIPGLDYSIQQPEDKDSIGENSFKVLIKKMPEKTAKTIRLIITGKSADTSIQASTLIFSENGIEKVREKDITNTPKMEFVNYTDFKGFDQYQPNGIAQSQFLFKIPVNNYYRLWKDGETKTQWLRSFILPNFLFNRIDKTNEGVSLQPALNKNSQGDTSVSSVISSFDFIRYSSFVLNSRLTVFTVMRPKSRIQFQFNGSLFKIKVDSAKVTTRAADSTLTQSTVGLNPVYATGFGAELFYDTKYVENEFPFNFRFILGGQTIKMRSSEYQQADVAVTTPDNLRKTAQLIDGQNRKRSAPVWYFSAMIKKNLNLKTKESGEDHFLFFRYNYSWQQFKGMVAMPNRPGQYEEKTLNNNFSQFQLGIDLNFDGFFQ